MGWYVLTALLVIFRKLDSYAYLFVLFVLKSRPYWLLKLLIINFVYVQLEDMNMDEASEEVAVEIAAQGVLGKRVDEMEASFMMALDYMIQLADSDQDDKVPTSIAAWYIP